MAKKTKLQVWTGDAFEDLFPETHISLINMDGGDNLLHKLNTIEAIAKGAQQSVVYNDYEEAIEIINNLPEGALNFGQNIYIIDVDIPDLWVSGTMDTKNKYNYVSNEELVNALNTEGAIWVGHYILSQLEGGSKAVVSGLYSQVTINGVHQPTWDADTKLDKSTKVTGYPQTYVKAGDGTQTMYNVSTDIVNGAIPRRTTNGDVLVNNMPVSPYGAVNRNYVDTNFLTKQTGITQLNQAYVKTTAGNNEMFGIDANISANTLVRRNNNGDIIVSSNPASTNVAVNANYVSNNFIAKPTAPVNSIITYVNSTGVGTKPYTNKIPYENQFCSCAGPNDGVDEPAGTGYFISKNPINPYHLTTKNYVDGLFANAGGGGGTKLYLHALGIASTINNSTLNIKNPTGEIKVLCTKNTALTLDELLKNEVIFISGYCTDNSSFNGIWGVMLTRNIAVTMLNGVDYANNTWCSCSINSITSDTITEF